uniref:Reverse transcriptase n=1 Tax=Papilio xuthus TaxID=66420 RepID=Q8MY31_PAPXU|nr:reverse transcriptase [Papilio xuthus]
MALHLLQANVNHCARAQDLLIQSMAEWATQIAVVSEPYYVPNRDDWVGDEDSLVALIVPRSARPPSIDGVQKGRGYVGATIGGTLVVGVYCAPSMNLVEFEDLLERVGTLVGRNLPHSVLVMGDFNAKSSAWGSTSTNARGAVLEEWALTSGLCLLNRGSRPTCVRTQGSSIVDLTFACPATARRVYGWEVVEGVETLSDHRYIRFAISTTPTVPAHQGPESLQRDTPRWVVKRLNTDLLIEAAQVETWSPADSSPDLANRTAELRASMTRVCDASMPRQGPPPRKRQVYWWSADIAAMRVACVAARRQYQRQRRRRQRDEIAEASLHDIYKAAKHALSRAICEAKDRAREELIETLNLDPWGRPYRMVRGKLRTRASPLTQSLQPQLVRGVVGSLFPNGVAHTPPFRIPTIRNENPDSVDEEDIPPITPGEFGAGIHRLRAKRTAPGPDGIPGRAWVLAADVYEERVVGLMSDCLAHGRFPLLWKNGNLVLLKKEGRPADSPAAYRPIILLDEVAKLFERIIANRLIKHMTTVGPDLDEKQFGFRAGRSTIHTIMRVKKITEEAIAQGNVVLAVSLDIANAFNTLPWSCIIEALRYHQVPKYLRRIITDYLSARSVSYRSRDEWCRHEVTCGVPQGSVLGPLPWNVGYDWVLRGANIQGVDVTCYADDTLVTARGSTYRDCAILATAGVAQVVGRIRALGLEVALQKSEALYFHGPRSRPPPGAHIVVGGVNINIESHIRYLGLMLDGRWTFEGHFRQLGPKLMRTAAALGSLLPNVGGPKAACRRLFTGVVQSMALYGAPVWSGALNSRTTEILHRPQRTMAIRMIRGYRTVSYDAACTLAGSLPWVLEAEILAAIHTWRELKITTDGAPPLRVEVEAFRKERREEAVSKWQRRLRQTRAGARTIGAICPVFMAWLRRRHGAVTFRLAQVLSGHGCFGSYLRRIGREPSAVCHHCDDCPEDTAQHTLAECPAWTEQRRDLVAAVGDDLSLPATVRSMVESDGAWRAVQTYCEAVMTIKEEAERAREATSQDAIRSRRTGGRRRAYARTIPP